MEPDQCPDCIGDERLTVEERSFRYCCNAVMNDYYDDNHLPEKEQAERNNEAIRCGNSDCKERKVKLRHLDHFWNHILTVHGVPLRPSDYVR